MQRSKNGSDVIFFFFKVTSFAPEFCILCNFEIFLSGNPYSKLLQ